MQVFDKLVDVGDVALSLGFFDGVHVAHKELILSCVDYAKKNNLKSAVLTFREHPCVSVFNMHPEYITLYEKRLDLIANLGVDYVFVLDFDKKLCETQSLDFLEKLCKVLSLKAVFTGYNFFFGRNKTGSPVELEKYSQKFEYKYFKIPEIKVENYTVSSTNIRNFLMAGDIISANKLSGRNFEFKSKVVTGNKLGRTIGFPTINLIYPNKLVKLKYGVYQVDVDVLGKLYNGIMNYGLKPTLKITDNLSVEVHLLNFSKNIYNEEVTVYPKLFLREQKKFDSLEALKNQISSDISKII